MEPEFDLFQENKGGYAIYLTYNSWGDQHSNGMPNQLSCAAYTDLENWHKHQPLARNITVDENGNPRRINDAAVALVNGKYYFVWKVEQKIVEN